MGGTAPELPLTYLDAQGVTSLGGEALAEGFFNHTCSCVSQGKRVSQEKKTKKISKCDKKFPSLTAKNILFRLLSPTLGLVSILSWQMPTPACHTPHDSLQRNRRQ